VPKLQLVDLLVKRFYLAYQLIPVVGRREVFLPAHGRRYPPFEQLSFPQAQHLPAHSNGCRYRFSGAVPGTQSNDRASLLLTRE